MRHLSFIVLAASLLAGTAHAKTIGFAVANGSDTFQHSLSAVISKTVAENPGNSLKILDAGASTEKQSSQIKQFIAEKVDVLIIALADGDMGAEASSLASAANIPVVYVNNTPSNFDALPARETLVAADEKAGATLQAQEFCRQMNGKGKVVILLGQLFHDAARMRTTIEEKVLSSPPCNGIEIVESQSANWSNSQAESVMEEWLNAGVKFDGVLANNDDMALGAIAAMKRHDIPMNKVVVAGVDATAPALKAMAAGDLDITILQNANAIGKLSVEQALKLANGQSVEKHYGVPFELVTPANLEKYLAKTE